MFLIVNNLWEGATTPTSISIQSTQYLFMLIDHRKSTVLLFDKTQLIIESQYRAPRKPTEILMAKSHTNGEIPSLVTCRLSHNITGKSQTGNEGPESTTS